MSMADEITLDDQEIKSIRVLYTDLVESLPCLCEVRICTDIRLYLLIFSVGLNFYLSEIPLYIGFFEKR